MGGPECRPARLECRLENELQSELNHPSFPQRIENRVRLAEPAIVHSPLRVSELRRVEGVEELPSDLQFGVLAGTQVEVLEQGKIEVVMRPTTQAGDSAVAECPDLRGRESVRVEELLDGPGALRVTDAVRSSALAVRVAIVGAANPDGGARGGTPDAVELPAAQDVTRRPIARRRDLPSPVHDEPMRLVEDQPSIVGCQIIGILRPDQAGRRSAREIVLCVSQRFAPGVVHVEGQASGHWAPQARLQGVVVGLAVAGQMVAQTRPVREGTRHLSIRVDVTLVQRLELANLVGVSTHVRDIQQIIVLRLELEPEAVLL